MLWQPAAQSLLPQSFVAPADAWTITQPTSRSRSPGSSDRPGPGLVSAEGVIIEPGSDRAFIAGRSVAWPGNEQYVRFEVHVRTLEAPQQQLPLIRGQRHTQRSLVHVTFRDAAGDRVGGQSLVQMDGRHTWVTDSGVLKVPAHTKNILLRVIGRGYGGRYLLEHAELQPVRANPSRIPVIGALALLWGLVFAVAARWAVAHIGWKGLISLAAVGGLIVWGVTLSEQAFGNTLKARLDTLVWGTLGMPHMYGPLLFKIGHATAFCIATFTMLVFLANKRRGVGVLYVLACIVCIAIASESLQRYLVDRSPELRDVFIDLAGALAGFLLWALVSWMSGLGAFKRATAADM